MLDAFARHWRRHYNTPHGKKVLRYTLVSVISTVFGFTLLGIVFGVFHLWSEVPSALFVNLVGIVPNYYLNRNWVWRKTGPSHWRREVLPFWAVSIAAILLSIVAAQVAHQISTAHHFSHGEATALLLSVTLAVFGFLWVFKYLVFSRLFSLDAVQLGDESVSV